MGSVMNAASSVLMLLAVTRILGVYAGGVFSLAYAVSQQFQTIGAFEMRPYQATNLSKESSLFLHILHLVLLRLWA